MNKSRRVLFPFLAISVVLVVTLACGGTTSTSAPQTISTATTATSAIQPTVIQPSAEIPATVIPATEIAATETPAAEYFLGDAIQKDGIALTALTVTDPATPGMLYQPETGKKLIAVEIIISNISGDILSVNPLYITLLDDGGFVYQAELGGIDDQISTLDLNPGEQVRGWISFKIKESANAAIIKYSTQVFGNDYLQAPLSPPPAGHTPVSVAINPTIPTAKLGDVVEKSGYSLTVINVEDPASPGILYTPREDYKLVGVEIILGNVSGATEFSANPLYSFLVDTNGFVYSSELGGRDGQIQALDINAGEKAQGWVSFTIPENAIPAYIKYQIQVFSDEFLISGLTE